MADKEYSEKCWRSKTGIRTIDLTGLDQLLVPASEDRIALIIGPPSSGVITVSPEPSVSEYLGLVIRAGDAPIRLERKFLGEIVTSPWRVLRSAEQSMAVAPHTSQWVERAGAFGNATATRAAVAGEQHMVTSISGSYFSAVGLNSLELIDGVTTIWASEVSNPGTHVQWTSPIPITVGVAVSALLKDGGGGMFGLVNITGYTLAVPRLVVYEIMG